jgi:hypothetical protein
MEHVGADDVPRLERVDGFELRLQHLPQFSRHVEAAPLLVLRRAGVQAHDARLEVHAVHAIMRTVVDQHVVGRSLGRLDVTVGSAEVRRSSPTFDAHDPAVEG